MAQRTPNPDLPQATLRQRKAEPPWLWLALITGSAVIHSVLAIAAVPLLQQLSGSESEMIASVPIELVDLPPESVQSSPQAGKELGLGSIAASPPQPPSQSNAPASSKPTIPSPTAGSAPTSPKVPFVDSSRVLPPAQPESANPAVGAVEGEQQPNRSTDPQSTGTPEGATAPTPTAQPSPPATAETPGFATIPIDIPTPDVSQTLPPSPAPSPATPLAQVGVNRENTPVRLVVNLELERISAEKAGDNPDRLATPQGGIESREISTVDESACAGALKPEIMQSLGVKVGLQVSTDATGQVTQTATQVASRNSAYNELARCLVQHWGFVPAEEEGEPVPSSALLVWVTIERR